LVERTNFEIIFHTFVVAIAAAAVAVTVAVAVIIVIILSSLACTY
jgi:hypothetical protein